MFLIKKSWKRWAVLSSLSVLFSTSPVWGDDGGAPQGVTDSEIRIGHLGPQTGPVAAYDKIRMGIQAYFNYVNERGGVKGRKLRLIAYDDQ